MSGELGLWVLVPVIGFAAGVAWARWLGYYPARTREYDPEAERRSAELLSDLLSEEERLQLRHSGYLAVPSTTVAGREYRIPRQARKVDVYECGKLVMRVCVEPVGPLPSGDLVLMHKLMIEASEQRYLEVANVHWRSRSVG